MINKILENNQPNLYIISTPIGNLQDISKRALKILEEISILLCEDTRKTGLLLKRLNILNKPKLIRFDIVKENDLVKDVLKLFEKHSKIGLCSNAGTPLISDPGFRLIKAALVSKINIVSIPGACAYLNALTISGFSTINTFLGFTRNKTSQIEKDFLFAKSINTTIIYYVSSHKLLKTLTIASKIFPEQNLFIAKEITKIHETHYLAKGKNILDLIPTKIVGEYVLLIDNYKKIKSKL